MPAVYDKLGIRFLYPDNWESTKQWTPAGNQCVSVFSPQGAFWSVTVHPLAADPVELAAAALRTLQAEYADSEAEAILEDIGQQSIAGYDLSFFYLDFTNTALVRGFRTASATCLVLCQAEDREFERVAPVFRAITTSLLAPAGE